jgi:hypothetical protein
VSTSVRSDVMVLWSSSICAYAYACCMYVCMYVCMYAISCRPLPALTHSHTRTHTRRVCVCMPCIHIYSRRCDGLCPCMCICMFDPMCSPSESVHVFATCTIRVEYDACTFNLNFSHMYAILPDYSFHTGSCARAQILETYSEILR